MLIFSTEIPNKFIIYFNNLNLKEHKFLINMLDIDYKEILSIEIENNYKIEDFTFNKISQF